MKQSIVISESNIVSDAARISQRSDMPTSMSKAVELEVLPVGTLQKDSVKANVKGTGVPKRVYGQFAYIDTEKLAWRSFRISNFVGIID